MLQIYQPHTNSFAIYSPYILKRLEVCVIIYNADIHRCTRYFKNVTFLWRSLLTRHLVLYIMELTIFTTTIAWVWKAMFKSEAQLGRFHSYHGHLVPRQGRGINWPW